MLFLRLLLLIVRRKKARSGQTAGRVCATFKAHTKKNKIYRKHLHIDKAHSENVTHSNEERNTIRGRVAPSSQRQHTTFTMSSRVINPNKQVAHDAVKCGSPDGLSRRNSGWRSARKRDRPASDATLARKIGQRCASRPSSDMQQLGDKKVRVARQRAIACVRSG